MLGKFDLSTKLPAALGGLAIVFAALGYVGTASRLDDSSHDPAKPLFDRLTALHQTQDGRCDQSEQDRNKTIGETLRLCDELQTERESEITAGEQSRTDFHTQQLAELHRANHAADQLADRASESRAAMKECFDHQRSIRYGEFLAAADEVSRQCAELQTRRRAELAAAREVRTIGREQHQARAAMAEELLRLATDVRLIQQTYLGSEESVLTVHFHAALDQIVDRLGQLDASLNGGIPTVPSQELRRAAQECRTAFDAVVVTRNAMHTSRQTMIAAAETASRHGQSLWDSRREQVEQDLDSDADAAELTRRFAIAQDAQRLTRLMADCRTAERAFTVEPTTERLGEFHALIDTLATLAETLASRINVPEDVEQTDRIVAAVEQYRKASDHHATQCEQRAEAESAALIRAEALVAGGHSVRDWIEQDGADSLRHTGDAIARHAASLEEAHKLAQQLQEARTLEGECLGGAADALDTWTAAADNLKSQAASSNDARAMDALVAAAEQYRHALPDHLAQRAQWRKEADMVLAMADAMALGSRTLQNACRQEVADAAEAGAPGERLAASGHIDSLAQLLREVQARETDAASQRIETQVAVTKSLDDLRSAFTKSRVDLWTETAATTQRANRRLTLLAAAGLLLTLGLSFLVKRRIARPIRSCLQSAAALSEGRLDAKANVHGDGQLAQLADAVNRSIDAAGQAIVERQEMAARETQLRQDLQELDRRYDEADQQHQRETADAERLRVESETRRREKQEAWQRDRVEVERAEAQRLQQTIDDLASVVAAATEGDLARTAQAEGDERFEPLAEGINRLLGRWAGVVDQMAGNVGGFDADYRALADGFGNLLRQTQQQSSDVQRIGLSLEQLTRSTIAIRESAEQADRQARRTDELAHRGDRTMRQSIETIERVRADSVRMAENAKAISDIADQTNMLAMNAAIEAARAGQHGLGFAVVADEVRKLADRSNQIAREIAKRIKETTGEIEKGVRLNEETGSSLREIAEGAEVTAVGIAQMMATADQQAAAAEEASNAIATVVRSAEHLTADGSPLDEHGQSLEGRVAALRDLIAPFRGDVQATV